MTSRRTRITIAVIAVIAAVSITAPAAQARLHGVVQSNMDRRMACAVRLTPVDDATTRHEELCAEQFHHNGNVAWVSQGTSNRDLTGHGATVPYLSRSSSIGYISYLCPSDVTDQHDGAWNETCTVEWGTWNRNSDLVLAPGVAVPGPDVMVDPSLSLGRGTGTVDVPDGSACAVELVVVATDVPSTDLPPIYHGAEQRPNPTRGLDHAYAGTYGEVTREGTVTGTMCGESLGGWTGKFRRGTMVHAFYRQI